MGWETECVCWCVHLRLITLYFFVAMSMTFAEGPSVTHCFTGRSSKLGRPCWPPSRPPTTTGATEACFERSTLEPPSSPRSPPDTIPSWEWAPRTWPQRMATSQPPSHNFPSIFENSNAAKQHSQSLLYSTFLFWKEQKKKYTLCHSHQSLLSVDKEKGSSRGHKKLVPVKKHNHFSTKKNIVSVLNPFSWQALSCSPH